jgi:uncharacterized membrane protein
MKKEDKIKTIEEDVKDIEKTKKNFLWVQEFSKKIIVALFLMYLVYNIISILLILYSAYRGEIIGFETFTTEMNETFRLIVGGYLIKAGLENITKIGGNYYDNVNKIRLAKMREKLGLAPVDETDDFNSDVNSSTYEESFGPGDLS